MTDKRASALWIVASCMIAQTLIVSCASSMMRYVTAEMHPFEIVFFRNLFAIIVILPWMMRDGFAPFRTQRIGTHLSRASVNVVSNILFVCALAAAPLADVVAINFSAPLFATMFGALVLSERVGIRRWSALLAGFGGTLLVLRPGFTAFESGHLFALVSSATWAVCLLHIRSLGRTESSLTIVAHMTVLMTLLSIFPALFVWQTPTLAQIGWLFSIGLCGGAGQYLLAHSLRLADLSVVMPFDFFKLAWVSMIAFWLFSETLEIWTWMGGAIILASAVYVVLRERKVSKQALQGELSLPGDR